MAVGVATDSVFTGGSDMVYQFFNSRLDTAGEGTVKPDKNKLTQYLFFNFAHLLRKSGETIEYEAPQYSSPDTGFAMTMLRVDMKVYDYAVECFRVLGKEPSLNVV